MIAFHTAAYLDHLKKKTVREFDYEQAMRTGDWQRWQRDFRKRLKELLGLTFMEAAAGWRETGESRLVEKKQCDGYTMEKRYLATEPGIEIPFYLLLPAVGNQPFPVVLTPHGHNRRGKEVYTGNYETEAEAMEALEGERDIALQAVREGYAVIAPDVRGFWEMSRIEELTNGQGSSCDELQRMAMMYGRTLIGERVHDIGKLIDYAESRPELDSSKIVITGNSGGGTVSLFAAAIDERIRIAMPGSYFCTFFDSVVSLHHCACNIVPGIMQIAEMYDIAGLIAPRPFLAINGVRDPIFPFEAAQEAFAHVKRIYTAMGHQDRCELYAGQGEHRYYKERAWSFVKEHLKR